MWGVEILVHVCGCKNQLEIDLEELENASLLDIEVELDDLSEQDLEKLKSLTVCKQCQNGFHVTRLE